MGHALYRDSDAADNELFCSALYLLIGSGDASNYLSEVYRVIGNSDRFSREFISCFLDSNRGSIDKITRDDLSHRRLL